MHYKLLVFWYDLEVLAHVKHSLTVYAHLEQLPIADCSIACR